jgi:hypothetical protein
MAGSVVPAGSSDVMHVMTRDGIAFCTDLIERPVSASVSGGADMGDCSSSGGAGWPRSSLMLGRDAGRAHRREEVLVNTRGFLSAYLNAWAAIPRFIPWRHRRVRSDADTLLVDIHDDAILDQILRRRPYPDDPAHLDRCGLWRVPSRPPLPVRLWQDYCSSALRPPLPHAAQ